MNQQEAIKQLYSARMLSTSSDYELFDDALEKLEEPITADEVCELCKVFHDGTNDDEVMFGLVHFIEQLERDEYLKCIAKCTPNMEQAPVWAKLLNKRIINNQQDFNRYIAVINDLDSHGKDKIFSLLKEIKEDNPQRFGEKIDLILSTAKGSNG